MNLYKVTVTDHDYHSTTYTAWVRASSKQKAIVTGAGLAGAEKTHGEWKRMGREPWPEMLLDPDVSVELVTVDEYYQHGDGTVEVSDHS